MTKCILFQGALSNGVPQKRINGKRVNLNRHLFKGDLPYNHKVFKTCKNPSCINSDHFYSDLKHNYTTPQYPDRSKEANNNVVLDQKTVDEIREFRKETGLSYKKIGLKFKVSATQAWRICRFKSWEEK